MLILNSFSLLVGVRICSDVCERCSNKLLFEGSLILQSMKDLPSKILSIMTFKMSD